jgi:hypothetical protein
MTNQRTPRRAPAGPRRFRDQPHQIADNSGRDHADAQRRHNVREVHGREQIGRNHAACAEEGRLAEGEQTGEADACR